MKIGRVHADGPKKLNVEIMFVRVNFAGLKTDTFGWERKQCLKKYPLFLSRIKYCAQDKFYERP